MLLDPYPVLWTYAGMFLAGAMFLAIGLFISSLVRNQMVAAILALAVGLLFVGGGFWRPEQTGIDLYQHVVFLQRAAALRPRLHARLARYAAAHPLRQHGPVLSVPDGSQSGGRRWQ